MHARDTLTRLVELGVVPVVNENDTVTVDEIRFGDNDTLAALVACLVSADLCVTLSDIDGLYTQTPRSIPRRASSRASTISNAQIIASAGDSSTSVGTGGMITKIRASRILMTAGIPSVICSGEDAGVLARLAAGEEVGTRFEPPRERCEIAPRKLWIALGDAAHGRVTVDDGAARAPRPSEVPRCCRWELRRLRAPSRRVRCSTSAMRAGSCSLVGISEAGSDELALAAGTPPG